MPRPLKAELNGYEGVKKGSLSAVWERLGVSTPTEEQWNRIKNADDRLFQYEADTLLAGFEPATVPDLSYDLSPCDPTDVRARFRERAKHLSRRVEQTP